MNSKDILHAVVRNVWDHREHVCVPATTGVVGYEADLLVLHKTGWMEEVEIKTSRPDFLREFKAQSKITKHRVLKHGRPPVHQSVWHLWCNGRGGEWVNCQPQPVRRFWYAIPEELLVKIENDVPEYAGILVVSKDRRTSVVKHRPAQNLPSSRKVNDREREALLRSAYFKAWDLILRGKSSMGITKR